jgi:hypothetical protein
MGVCLVRKQLKKLHERLETARDVITCLVIFYD